MRKDNSDFKTDFVTDAGDYRYNRDYFAFVELDDLACWVIASGLDTAKEKLSSEIVVNSIINDFTEKPSMSRRAVKNYIKNANKVLLNESRIVKLHATVMVIISDYSSFVWGNVGNTRLYYMHKDKIKKKSKDHSVSQMMLEAGEIDEVQFNQHIERKNLTRYLGKNNRVKPYVSKKINLKDSDVLLTCTSGYWENIKDQQIEDILKEVSEPEDFVVKLEESLLDNEEGELLNYSIVSIFANKIFKESEKKKSIYKKVAVLLVPLLILSGGYAVYRKVKTVNARKAAVMLKNQRFSTNKKQEENGDDLYGRGKYKEALTAYNKTRDNYLELNEKEEAGKTSEKIEKVELIINGKKHENNAHQLLKKGDYQSALESFDEAKSNYLKSNDYILDDLEKNIEKTRSLIKASSYEEEGNLFQKSGNYSIAKEKYNSAASIYRTYNLTEKNDILLKKVEDCQKLMMVNNKEESGRKIENQGDEFYNLQEYDQAVMKYIEAKVIYSELEMLEKVASIEEKIKKIDEIRDQAVFSEKKIEAEKLEKEADTLFFLMETGQANAKYMQAKNIYEEINLVDRVKQIEEKLIKIEDSKKEKEIQITISKAQTIEREADELIQLKEYVQAREKYMQVKAIYSQSGKTTEVNRIQKKIENINITQSKNEIDKYIQLGNIQLSENNYDEALFNYRQARKISMENNLSEKTEQISNLISSSGFNKYRNQALKYENAGDMLLEEQNFSEAIFNYKQAKIIYIDNDITKYINSINKKISNATLRKKYYAAQGYEDEGEMNYKNKKYEDSLNNYQKALSIYQEIKKDKDVQRVNEKINLIKDEQKSFFGKIIDAF
ncbi:MAG: hypothetical protein ACOC1O_01070 [bacterium]